MDLMLPGHLCEPGHRVPRDDPPHDSRPLAHSIVDASAAETPRMPGADIGRPIRRAAVCGLRDWRSSRACPPDQAERAK